MKCIQVDEAHRGKLRELGRPHVAAWLEVRGIKTLNRRDAADLMERVGAAIEAESQALQSRLAQVTQERDDALTILHGVNLQ